MIRKQFSRSGACVPVLLLLVFMAMLPAGPLQAANSGNSASGFSLKGPVHFLIGVHAGVNIPQAKGDLFGWLTNSLTLEKSMFRVPDFGFDFGVPFHPHFAAIASFDYARFTRESEYRHYIEDNGYSILQSTRFTQTSFVGTLRYYPVKTGETVGSYVWIPTRIMPYIGAGGGIVHYNINQYGDFVDEASPTLDIYSTTKTSSGSSLNKHLAAGLDIALSPRAVVNMEGRYSWARAGIVLRDYGTLTDYRFLPHIDQPVDLGGLKLTGGIYFRF